MSDIASKDGSVNDREGLLEQVLRIARRRKWVVLQAALGVPLLALGLSITQEKEYTAEATLLFRQAPVLEETSSVIDPTREAATNGQLVGLPIVAERAAGELGDVAADEILASVVVTPSADADTATISATTPSAERSAQIANAYGRAYISFRRRADRDQVQDAIDLAESSLADLGLAEEGGAEGKALNEQLDKLRLIQALQTGGAELVQPATAPSSPSSPKPLRNTALGLVLGLLLGFALAALLERVDRRIRTSEEMEDLYGLPVLARIPRSNLLGGKRARSLGTRTPEGEAFRVLRTNLRFFDVEREMKSILIVSPEEGDGKSTVAQGLATTMAEMGDDAVLVETDLRKGGAFRQVDGRAAGGLSNVLAGTPLDKVLIKVDVPIQNSDESRALAVLPSGPAPPNPSELLEGDRMSAVLDELSQHFRYVILDSPALGAVSDALALVPMASQIVVVGGLGKTTREAARALMKQFALLNRQPIGVIVNFAETERAKYSHYYRSEPAGSASPS